MAAINQDVIDSWSPSRLISASGIKGTKEQEMRATSALLSVMAVVPSFGRRVLAAVDAPTGRMSTFVECSFKTDDGGTARPDGVIVVERGQRRWACIVEVKTGPTDLSSDQVNGYLTIANRDGFNAVLTISNQIVGADNVSPVSADKRKLRNVRLGHMSWFRILTEAVTEYEHRGVDDPEQSFILRDLIAYLDDPRSGAAGFDGMGKEWVRVRDAARNKTLRLRDQGVAEVANNWSEFGEYMALRLRQRLGRGVEAVYPKGSTPNSRVDGHIRTLGTNGVLAVTIRVPDAVAPIDVSADLGALQVTTSARVKAPQDGRTRTRINWLLRQLKDAPNDLRITGRFLRTPRTTSLLLKDVREDATGLLLPEDPKRELVWFDIALTRDMGIKGGNAKGSFVADTMSQVSSFYGDVVQDIQPWQARPPRLNDEPDESDPLASAVAVSLSADSPPIDEEALLPSLALNRWFANGAEEPPAGF